MLILIYFPYLPLHLSQTDRFPIAFSTFSAASLFYCCRFPPHGEICSASLALTLPRPYKSAFMLLVNMFFFVSNSHRTCVSHVSTQLPYPFYRLSQISEYSIDMACERQERAISMKLSCLLSLQQSLFHWFVADHSPKLIREVKIYLTVLIAAINCYCVIEIMEEPISSSFDKRKNSNCNNAMSGPARMMTESGTRNGSW